MGSKTLVAAEKEKKIVHQLHFVCPRGCYQSGLVHQSSTLPGVAREKSHRQSPCPKHSWEQPGPPGHIAIAETVQRPDEQRSLERAVFCPEDRSHAHVQYGRELVYGSWLPGHDDLLDVLSIPRQTASAHEQNRQHGQ